MQREPLTDMGPSLRRPHVCQAVSAPDKSGLEPNRSVLITGMSHIWEREWCREP